MAKTLIAAFDEFMLDTVNLDVGETKKARDSREWLVGQIGTFPDKEDNFPRIYSEKNIFFGSFSRSTKKRPLDDIDLMICMSADNCTYLEHEDKIEITVPSGATRFLDYVNEGTSILNSRKIINAFVAQLQGVPQYKKAEIKRNLEAATLDLETYNWVFDIVPCFFTKEDMYGNTYYIIPDGSGNWKKTDPRLDTSRTKKINSDHGGHVLSVIRAIKYWNVRPTMPTMSSYLLENMVLDYFAGKDTETKSWVDVELIHLFRDLQVRVYSAVNDPKGIQGDLNILSFEERKKIAERAKKDAALAYEAWDLENNKNDQKGAIQKWQEIFGDQFPNFTE